MNFPQYSHYQIFQIGIQGIFLLCLTDNVENMNELFRNCSSLLSLPDISNWSISKVSDISSMFEICQKLKYLLDLSKWKKKKIINISYIFNE